MPDEVKLLSEPTNYAVVQLPGRKFPGVVFQGDSVHGILSRLEKARLLADGAAGDDMRVLLDDLIEIFVGVQHRFEEVSLGAGLTFPY